MTTQKKLSLSDIPTTNKNPQVSYGLTERILRITRSTTRQLERGLCLGDSSRGDRLQSAYLGAVEAIQRGNHYSEDHLVRHALKRARGSVMDTLRKDMKYLSRLDTDLTHEDVVQGIEDNRLGRSSSPEQLFADKQIISLLRNAIKELPAIERGIIEEHYFKERKLSELVTKKRKLPAVSKRHKNALNILRMKVDALLRS